MKWESWYLLITNWNMKENFPWAFGFFLYSFEVNHKYSLPSTDKDIDSLKSTSYLEINGAQSKVNLLGSMKHVVVEPLAPKSLLPCRYYSNTVVCKLKSWTCKW